MIEIFKFFLLIFISVQLSEAFKINETILTNLEKEKCETRPRGFTVNKRNYFFSNNHPDTKGREVSWMEARNICRKYCMDTISIESQDEFDKVKEILEEYLVDYIWTSGRVCDSKECLGNEKFHPLNINGWFWAHNGVRIPDTSVKAPGWSFNPWSQTGMI